MMKMRWKSVKTLVSATALAAAMAATSAPALAQQCPGDDSGPSATLSPRIGQEIQKIYELMQNDQPREAIAGFNNLLNSRGDSMSAYERATVFELRGSQKAAVEDFDGALRDFQAALNSNGLAESRNNQLRYFIAQLQFQDGNYQAAIQGLNNWINIARQCNVPVDNSALYLLAAAYTQISPPNWRAAVTPAEQAVQGLETPNKSYYDLLNLIYSELGEATKRGSLLERMVNIWPGEKSYWTQLSGLYSQNERDQDAFSVLEVAYRAGLLTTEAEMKTLIQYYSFFDNPFRGAKMLEREMNAGNIRRTQDNLVLLSQLWSQAREHKRSIPILREAANNSSEGELSYRLGMVLLADEQYSASQRALEQAINKGGMNNDDTGDAWLLLGTARFSQAGPEDTEIWANARRAFVSAQRYPDARAQASQWISYIDAVRSTYEAQRRLEEIQRRERCEADLARIEQQQRIRDLQNREATQEERAFEARVRSQCGENGEAQTAEADTGDGDENAPAGGDEGTEE